MFHADSGSLHHIENIGDERAELIIAFRHERPAFPYTPADPLIVGRANPRDPTR